MTGTNHFLAGATIGLSISAPVVALPLAFVSHFVLDALPHFGVEYDPKIKKRPNSFKYVVRLDVLLLSLILLLAISTQSWVVPACMLLALSPDFVWIYKYTVKEQFGKLPPSPKGRLSQFHKDIQRYERHWGIYVEVVFAAVLAAIVVSLV